MRPPGPEQELKAQLARELRSILSEYPRYVAAARIDADVSELSRLRRDDLRRFSLGRIIRYISRAGYDIEVHLKKTPRREERPKPRPPTSAVVRYDYFGRVVEST